MKKTLLLLLSALCIGACTSSRKINTLGEKKFFVGLAPDGYLAVGKSYNSFYLFTMSKDRLDSLTAGEIYKPAFSVPNDILVNQEYQIYHYRPTKGLIVYKQHSESRRWLKVAYFPMASPIESIDHKDDIVFIAVRDPRHGKLRTLKYRYQPNRPGYGEGYVLTQT